jgi:alpha-L-arabinofuranosidase
MKINIQLLCLLLGVSLLRAQAQTTIDVNTNALIASGVSHKYGINLNAGMDADQNRPAGARTLAQSLQEMGTKLLRFPGGEKSNYYVWADAPYTTASTAHWVPGSYYEGASLGRTIMNVDQFMTTCTQAGAEAQINVAYNPAEGLDQHVAAAWVHYANVTKQYGIKYWEVGNEMWNGKGLSAAQMGAIASTYAAAMKAVDPTIKVGVSWNSQAGFQTILTAAPNLDFVACSNYTTWNYASYDTYANTANIDLLADTRGAISAVGNSAKTVVVSEFNALNWASGWANTNDLGHALVNFETVGQLLTTPKIAFGSLWNTRWFGEEGRAYTLFTVLDSTNQLHASGLALSVWGKFLQDQLVSSTSSGTIKTYAAYNSSTKALNIFLENKAEYAQRVHVPITSANTYTSKAAVWQLKGTGASDQFPTWSPTDSVGVTANSVANLQLPAVSVTVLSLTPASSATLLAATGPAAAQAASVVFPNPFQSSFSFALVDKQELSEVHLLDVFGRAIPGVQVQRSGQQGQVTPPASLRAGMYLLRLTSGAGTTTVQKVVKR